MFSKTGLTGVGLYQIGFTESALAALLKMILYIGLEKATSFFDFLLNGSLYWIGEGNVVAFDVVVHSHRELQFPAGVDKKNAKFLRDFFQEGGFKSEQLTTEKDIKYAVEKVMERAKKKKGSFGSTADQIDEDSIDFWDVETLKCGREGLSNSSRCLFHLFCATYSHLLLVLDDIEFYEKQVPFTLEHQRKIASMLNTLVYNALSHSISQQSKTFMDAAIRCLHLLYERDCRHQFCPPSLWLSPARKNRPPITVAARTHGVLSTYLKADDSLAVPSTHSVITTTPHVFPFKERAR
ncbi:hypothetical protein POM88_029623 [Heracleum sosnowskyi]|uniref:HECT-type E3 ubiquitin transferase n=1 Tax=Heracleum sosnowskyi TaxID=360622 RepID=A0AAD8HUF7_9APIA|nr:hypothetical protein POM88_029623 [Heracleum sosnowskyi]